MPNDPAGVAEPVGPHGEPWRTLQPSKWGCGGATLLFLMRTLVRLIEGIDKLRHRI